MNEYQEQQNGRSEAIVSVVGDAQRQVPPEAQSSSTQGPVATSHAREPSPSQQQQHTEQQQQQQEAQSSTPVRSPTGPVAASRPSTNESTIFPRISTSDQGQRDAQQRLQPQNTTTNRSEGQPAPTATTSGQNQLIAPTLKTQDGPLRSSNTATASGDVHGQPSGPPAPRQVVQAFVESRAVPTIGLGQDARRLSVGAAQRTHELGNFQATLYSTGLQQSPVRHDLALPLQLKTEGITVGSNAAIENSIGAVTLQPKQSKPQHHQRPIAPQPQGQQKPAHNESPRQQTPPGGNADPASQQIPNGGVVANQELLDHLKLFLATAPTNWDPEHTIKRFTLPNGEHISCVLWNNLFHITGTDIVRSLIYRFEAFGRPVSNVKKFEEGVFSDLRNLKPGIDATLEEPRSEFLEILYKNNCIRTQKKQKVFYWFSVPHDRLFMDALERDLKREALGVEPTTVATHPMPLLPTLELAKQQCMPTLQLAPDLLGFPGDSNVALEDWINVSPTNTQFHDSIGQLAHEFQAQQHDGFSYDGSRNTSPNLSMGAPYLINSNSPEMSVGAPPSLMSDDDAASHNAMSHMGLQHQMPGIPGFGVFNLFEGSPNYKQRRRAQSLFSVSKDMPLLPPDFRQGGDISRMANAVTGDSFNGVQVPTLPSNHPKETTERRNYLCSFRDLSGRAVCGRKFKRYEHLRRHMRCHTGEKPYVCPVAGCNKEFSRSDNLSQHLKVHNGAAERAEAAANAGDSGSRQGTAPPTTAPEPTAIKSVNGYNSGRGNSPVPALGGQGLPVEFATPHPHPFEHMHSQSLPTSPILRSMASSVVYPGPGGFESLPGRAVQSSQQFPYHHQQHQMPADQDHFAQFGYGGLALHNQQNTIQHQRSLSLPASPMLHGMPHPGGFGGFNNQFSLAHQGQQYAMPQAMSFATPGYQFPMIQPGQRRQSAHDSMFDMHGMHGGNGAQQNGMNNGQSNYVFG